MSTGFHIDPNGCFVLADGCFAIGPCDGGGPPEPPECLCFRMGCCFDQANVRFQGNYYRSILVYGMTSSAYCNCTGGTLLGTVTLEAEFNIKNYNHSCVWGLFDQVVPEPGQVGTITWTDRTFHKASGGTEAVAIGAQLRFGIQPHSTASYETGPAIWAFNETQTLDLPSLGASGYLSWIADAYGNPLNMADLALEGECGGFTVETEYCQGQTWMADAPYHHFELHSTLNISMEVHDNYCRCGDEETPCVESETPSTETCA